jgi:hypothetical protein
MSDLWPSNSGILLPAPIAICTASYGVYLQMMSKHNPGRTVTAGIAHIRDSSSSPCGHFLSAVLVTWEDGMGGGLAVQA